MLRRTESAEKLRRMRERKAQAKRELELVADLRDAQAAFADRLTIAYAEEVRLLDALHWAWSSAAGLAAELECAQDARDRLQRILDVDRGKTDAVPEGWRRVGASWWRTHAEVWESVSGSQWLWAVTSQNKRRSGYADSALEAMEAADDLLCAQEESP